MQHENSTSTQSGYVGTFVQHSRSYYAQSSPLTKTDKNLVEEIYFNLADGDTGNFEFFIRWYTIGKIPTARLEIYDEAWFALLELQTLFERFKELGKSNPQPDEIVKVLLECGFVDETQEKRPSDELPTFEIAPNSNLTLEEIQSSDDIELINKLVEINLFVLLVRSNSDFYTTRPKPRILKAYAHMVDASYEFAFTRENRDASWALLQPRK